MREPHFFVSGNTLFFTFFQAGTNPLAFQPKFLFRIQRNSFQNWTTAIKWGQPGEIVWQINSYNDRIYASSYAGTHYSVAEKDVYIFLNTSKDGVNWIPLNPESPIIYKGGGSELGWTFDVDGNIWGVIRNEDGDSSGFGSRVIFCNTSKGKFEYYPNNKSDPWIYESPRMFTHLNDVYLVARRDLNGPFDRGNTKLSFTEQKALNLGEYSLRRHTTALYIINKVTKKVEWIMDLPGCGDTAFPSIIQLGPHKYLIANYSSPLQHTNWSWLKGQTSPEGTQIYFIEMEFVQE